MTTTTRVITACWRDALAGRLADLRERLALVVADAAERVARSVGEAVGAAVRDALARLLRPSASKQIPRYEPPRRAEDDWYRMPREQDDAWGDFEPGGFGGPKFDDEGFGADAFNGAGLDSQADGIARTGQPPLEPPVPRPRPWWLALRAGVRAAAWWLARQRHPATATALGIAALAGLLPGGSALAAALAVADLALDLTALGASPS